eukprot:gene11757-12828_t
MLSAVLPEDLLIEISSYIEENHQILFASVNKALSKQLLRKARTFLIDSENRLNEFFFSQSFHERIKRVIHHPYDQLNICVPPDFLPTFEGKEVLQGLSCNELLTCLELFISSQPLPFYNIRKISIIKEQIVQVDDTFATAMDRIIKANLGLEEMSLTNMDFTDLPALTGLKSLIVCETSLLTSNGLHISDYKNLQSLTLKNCSGIIDVGCLDGIPKLQLIECGGIRDITNLHHNHSIEIINCRMIDDYSKSFKFSKNISIDCSNSIFFVNLNFHLLTHVTWNLCYSNQKCSGFSGSCSSVTSVAGCQSICNNLNTGGTPTYPYLQYNAASSPTCCCILGQTCSGLVADSGGSMYGVTYMAKNYGCPLAPTAAPSARPSLRPVTAAPSAKPSTRPPTRTPSQTPSASPSRVPSTTPSTMPIAPTALPTTVSPSEIPTRMPSADPTASPTEDPSAVPTFEPTVSPTQTPSFRPSVNPTNEPTVFPTELPSVVPTENPTFMPTAEPTMIPTADPSNSPTEVPTATPSATPTEEPSANPTFYPTEVPSMNPTFTPSAVPTESPSTVPTEYPTPKPTYCVCVQQVCY